MRVMLDINVNLDSLLQRGPWHVEADAILQAALQGRVSCATTTLSLATIFYIGRREVGTAAARDAVRDLLSTFEVLSIHKQTLLAADSFAGSDFEDNILIAAAIAASLDAIVTRNPTDFTHSPIPVWSPAELLRRLSSGGRPPTAGAGS